MLQLLLRDGRPRELSGRGLDNTVDFTLSVNKGFTEAFITNSFFKISRIYCTALSLSSRAGSQTKKDSLASLLSFIFCEVNITMDLKLYLRNHYYSNISSNMCCIQEEAFQFNT